MKQKSFTVAAKEFFGLKPGQTILEFSQELKTLSYEDKVEIHKGFLNVGIDCTPPMPPATPTN